MLWDFDIEIDRELNTGKLEIVLIRKKKVIFFLIYIEIPWDKRAKSKVKKIQKYLDLAMELRIPWGLKLEC